MSIRGRHQLRDQVKSELKLRRYVAITILLLSLMYVGWNLAFGDMGIIRYMDLREKRSALLDDIKNIRSENRKVRADIDSYRGNDFYVEKRAREEYGLAGQDELIFIYQK